MTRRVLAAALVVAWAAACSGGSHSAQHAVGPTAPLLPAPTAAGDPQSAGTTVAVGLTGATIAAPDGGLVLAVPAAAVAASTAFTVTPIANLARGALGPAYRLGPEGTTFAVPVTLTFKGPASYPTGTSLAGVGVAYQDAAGYWHAVEPVRRDPAANTVSVDATHFSDWALVWQGGTAAAEGPISLVQTRGIPFTATGRATLFFMADDASDTSYAMTGTLTVPATIPYGDASCVPDQRTKTLPFNFAEAHKGTPPVFRWGIGVSWTLTCTGPGGATTTEVLPALFDTMSITLTRCAGRYAAGQVVTTSRIAGSYTTDCGLDGYVSASWDLQACVADQPCSTGVACRAGLTVCSAGVQSCVDAGVAADGTGCGGTSVCSVGVCVDPVDPSAVISVSPTSGLTTTEAGGAATFAVVLEAQPTTTVTIALSSDDPTEGTVSPASLTFTPGDWSVPRTVTVTGVDDPVADGDRPYAVITAPAVSVDPRYGGQDPADVHLTNLDDDVAGFVVSTAGALVTTEAGGIATFTVALSCQPTGDVSVALSSSDAAEGTVSPATLVFTPSSWDVAQVVTVAGVDDPVVDGDRAYTIVTAPAVSVDPAYAGRDPRDVPVTNLDDDHAGVTVTPTSGLVTTEAGGSATFTVVLTSRPTADVTIPLRSSAPAEGTVSPASVTFTPDAWNAPRAVTVTGVDDRVADGPRTYTIFTDPAVSQDPLYAGTDAPDVAVTNLDDDSPGITVTPTAGLVTTEGGGTATFTVRLQSQPTADVTIPLRSSAPGEGTVSPAALTFTSASWDVAQVVTVTGVNDDVADGPRAYLVVTEPAISADPIYSGRDAADVAVTNVDDDVAGVVVTPTSGLVTTEAGGAATFTVVLASQPTADVAIAFSSTNPAEGRVSPAGLTFTASTWALPQVVIVTGVDDLVMDGDQLYTIATGDAVSDDPVYGGTVVPDVSVTNQDDDRAGVVVTPTSGLVTTEAGGAARFTVVLTSQPTADVVVPLRSGNPGEGTLSAASLTFTPATWDAAQAVTVTGVDDAVVDGPQAFTVFVDPAASADAGYAGLDAADVAVTNLDDDQAGIVVTPTSGLVTTEAGGAATFTVRLRSRPAADVIVPLRTSDAAEGTVSAAGVTFTAATWDVAQVVTVTGVDDRVADGPRAYAVVTDPAVSADPLYAGLDAADVGVTNLDDDHAGVAVTPTAGLVTTEDLGTATFTVVLTSQPTASVELALSSSRPGEGTVAPATLTFTATSWGTPQTVTVTGVNDAVADGPQAYTIDFAPAVSADAAYAGTVAASVAVTNLDNDAAGIAVSPTSGLITTEAGTTASFTIVLLSRPTADVTIPLASTDVSEVTVSPASVTFTAATWDTPRTVFVTGVDDHVMDGDQLATIVTGPVASDDPVYAGTEVPDVSVTNVDDDHAGVVVSPTSGLVTSPGAPTASFSVVLTSEPTADVTIALHPSVDGVATVSPSSLTFGAVGWDAAQVVTITGTSFGPDPVAYTIVTEPAVGLDPVYAGTDAPDVSVTSTP